MKEEFESALARLLGLPTWGSYGAADMACFQFGAVVRGVASSGKRKGEPTVSGEYALHIQCAWRLRCVEGILVARRDYYYPAGDGPYEGLKDFDLESPRPNRREERLAAFRERHAGDPARVESVAADEVGGFRLALAPDCGLRSSPTTRSMANTGDSSRRPARNDTSSSPAPASNAEPVLAAGLDRALASGFAVSGPEGPVVGSPSGPSPVRQEP